MLPDPYTSHCGSLTVMALGHGVKGCDKPFSTASELLGKESGTLWRLRPVVAPTVTRGQALSPGPALQMAAEEALEPTSWGSWMLGVPVGKKSRAVL